MSRHDRETLVAELTDRVRAYQTATDELDELVGRLMGINRSDGRCLDILDRAGRMTAGRLAAESGLTTGAVTAVIDRLERAGLARRVPDERDRRKVLVEATEEARRAAHELYAGVAEAGAAVLARYSEEQIALFVEFMREAHRITVEQASRLRARAEGDKGGASSGGRVPRRAGRP